MIEVFQSQAISKTANEIEKLQASEGYRSLVRVIAAELAVKQVQLAQEISNQSMASIADGVVPSTAKSYLIRSGELSVALRIMDEFVNKPPEDLLEVELRVV